MRHWLWRAVDKHGVVLDILIQQRRDQNAAETFLRRGADGGWIEPRVVITDKLALSELTSGFLVRVSRARGYRQAIG